MHALRKYPTSGYAFLEAVMMQIAHVGFDSIIRAATAERSATGVANMYAISAFEQLGLSA